jgi:hypothetical protein
VIIQRSSLFHSNNKKIQLSKHSMKKIYILCACLALTGFVSCQKQQTEEERKAEIDRQVEQRLAAEHQAQEKENLAQRAAELDAREKTLSEKQEVAASTPTPRSRVAPETRAPDPSEEDAGYNTFYTKLEPYGDWRETSDYGYVWQPRAAEASRDWHPYTEGRWVYTDAGWTWISEEPFGWATYHYGRWTRLRTVGWVWVPGDEWAPAWVSWRKSDEYVGWAPLPPEASFDRRRGIQNWSDNYYDVGPEQYRFVSTREFGSRQIERTLVPRERNATIINQTTNVTNITYTNTMVVNQGPSYDELRTRSQQPIERLRLEREVNFDRNAAPRSVVRGEIVAVPAPIITIGRSIERPRHVKEPIAQAVVEHGWEGGDRQASEQARRKMKSEATPPSDAPSKTFVKPAITAQKVSAPAATAVPTASVAPATVTSSPTVMASASPAVSTSTPSTTIRPARKFSPSPRTTSSPVVGPSTAATSTPVATSTPAPSWPKPEATTPLPRQRSIPSATIVPPAHQLSPTPPSSEDASEKLSPRQRMLEKNQSRTIERKSVSPTPSPVATATVSAAVRSESTPTAKVEGQAFLPVVPQPPHFGKKRPEATGNVSPSPSPTP